jgi:microcystin-dependent protein
MALPVRKGYKGAPAQAVLTNSPTSGDTSFVVDTVTGWATTFPFYCVVEPGTSKEEKVKVTAISGTTLTVVRNQDDTNASGHNAGAAIYPVFTADEADEANLIASAMTTKGDLIGTDGSSINRLGVGTNTHVLQADSASTNGVKWGQVSAAGVALTLLKALCPVGSINAYAGATAPTGWILCNGTAVVSGTHPELYALCATTPDLRGSFALGKTAAGTGSTLLGTGGSTTIAEANLPVHSHANTAAFTGSSVNTGSTDPSHTHTYDAPVLATVNLQLGSAGITRALSTSTTNTSTNSSAAHTHTVTAAGTVAMTNATTGSGTAYYQPFLAVNYIIKHDYV